jgi:hypothetical protein
LSLVVFFFLDFWVDGCGYEGLEEEKVFCWRFFRVARESNLWGDWGAPLLQYC